MIAYTVGSTWWLRLSWPMFGLKGTLGQKHKLAWKRMKVYTVLFGMIVLSMFRQQKQFFFPASYLSCSGRSHVGSLFTNEEQKEVGLCLWRTIPPRPGQCLYMSLRKQRDSNLYLGSVKPAERRYHSAKQTLSLRRDVIKFVLLSGHPLWITWGWDRQPHLAQSRTVSSFRGLSSPSSVVCWCERGLSFITKFIIW